MCLMTRHYHLYQFIIVKIKNKLKKQKKSNLKKKVLYFDFILFRVKIMIKTIWIFHDYCTRLIIFNIVLMVLAKIKIFKKYFLIKLHFFIIIYL